MDLGLVRGQLGQHPPQPQRLEAQVGPDQVVAGGGRVALVEDEVHHAEHRRQAFVHSGVVGNRTTPASRQPPLGVGDALVDLHLVGQEGPGDLAGGQAGDQPQGQRDPSGRGQQRVAGQEHQPQDVVGGGRGVLSLGGLRGVGGHRGFGGLGGELVAALLEPLGPADVVDGPALGRGHQPGGGIVGDAGRRPLLERGDQRVLGELLGPPDVMDEPGQPGDDPG